SSPDSERQVVQPIALLRWLRRGLAVGRRLPLRRRRRIERRRRGVPVAVDARQQRHLALGGVEQAVAVGEQSHALFVLRQGAVEPKVAGLQRLDRPLQPLKGRLKSDFSVHDESPHRRGRRDRREKTENNSEFSKLFILSSVFSLRPLR